MDEILLKKMEQKIQDIISGKDEIKELAHLFSGIDNSRSFALGIAVGRMYNAFYYQSKRVLHREPTKHDFEEFLEFLKSRQPDIDNLW